MKASPESVDLRTLLQSSRKPLKLLPVITLLTIASSAEVSAQDFDKIAPRQLLSEKEQRAKSVEADAKSESEDLEAEAAKKKTSGEVELTQNLKGLIFVPKTSDIKVEGRPSVRGVKVEAVPLLDEAEWQNRLENHFGNRFTMDDLNEVIKQVILFYRASGRPVVDVVVVEQDITSGVIQLAVVEAVLGEVRVEGARYFKPEFLKGQVRLIPGAPIEANTLTNDLNWLNKNPFRTVDVIYTPGTKVGESDLILRVQDRRPWRVYTGYEDSGNDLTGDNRWSMGFNYGNLWGLDHQLSYQWTFADDIDHLSAHSMSYIAPLPWRHTLTFFGGYVESSAPLPEPLDLEGHTGQIGMRYKIPLPPPPKWRGLTYQHEVELGYDYKNSTNNLEFYKVPVLGVNTDVHQFLLSYRGSLRDETGLTSFGTSLYYSPGGIGGGNNDDEAYELARAGADSSYVYGQVYAERLQRLPYHYTAMLRVLGQWSNENLLPSEQLAVGGYSSVRGYEENEATLDQGFLMTLELRSPSFEILSHLKIPGVQDEAQFLIFWDYAVGSNVNRLPGESSSITMSSVGPGFRWSVGQYFTMRLDYGFQLTDSEQNLGMDSSRLHIGATLAY